jgi:hypothetical protein
VTTAAVQNLAQLNLFFQEVAIGIFDTRGTALSRRSIDTSAG